MMRNVLGSVLGLIGAAAAVRSPFRAWYDGRPGRDYRIQDLFTGAGVTDAGAALLGSILLPFLVAALLVLGAIVVRSRLLMACAGIVVLGFTVLWTVRQGQAAGSIAVGSEGQGIGDGVASAYGAGALILLGAAVMSGRPTRSSPQRVAPEVPPEVPPDGP
ncbi:hypothetical protein ABZZ20_17975 [Streptomyces sp. NPDC006430]|uniref:hypothetical protein n=1 Tax=Streptomyces sp. NPDC006430 TaxID=3154299 RepID=UPI0033AB7393